MMAAPNTGKKAGDLSGICIANAIFSANDFQLLDSKHAGIIRHECGCEYVLETGV